MFFFVGQSNRFLATIVLPSILFVSHTALTLNIITPKGGKSLFGEADILWYVPDQRPETTPESAGQLDLLHRQAILSGERMPCKLERK
jgi:hypothetical protein